MFDAIAKNFATDPLTGKPYVFGDQGWRWDGSEMAPTPGTDTTGALYRSNVNQSFLSGLPGYQQWVAQDPLKRSGVGGFSGVDSGEAQYNPVQDFLGQNNLRLASTPSGEGQYTQAFDASNNPVGKMGYVPNNYGDSAFGLGVGLMGLYGGALGAGLLGGGAEAGGLGANAAADSFAGINPSQFAGLTPQEAASTQLLSGSAGGLSSADAAALYGAEGYGAAATPAELGGVGAGVSGAGGAVGSAGGGGGSWLSNAATWAQQNPGLVNTGAGLLNGLIGSYQANQAIGAQRDATNQANALWAPYRQFGEANLARANALLGDPSAVANDPGYQFAVKQGQQALDRSAAARGGLYSGAQMKASQRFGQDNANQYFDRILGRYTGGAQLGATGTTNIANNLTGLGDSAAGNALYQGRNWQNQINNALGNWNFSQYKKGPL